jgi:hypothetical protein
MKEVIARGDAMERGFKVEAKFHVNKQREGAQKQKQ